MSILSWVLVVAICAGQLIKISFGEGGITILDLTVGFLAIINFFSWITSVKTFKINLINFSTMGFIIAAVVSLILSPIHLTANEKLIAASYIVRLGAFFSLLWFPSKLLSPLQKDSTKILLFSGVIIAVLGIAQLTFFPDLQFLAAANFDPHYLRTVSTFLDPNFTGAFLSLTAIILWPKLFTKDTFKSNVWIFILIYITLLTTFSRGGYLSLVSGLLIISLINKSFKQVLLTIVLGAILLFSFQQYTLQVAAPRKIDRAQSAAARLDTWQQGWNLFQRYPILGVGFNAYRYALKQLNLADEQFLSKKGASTNDSSLLYVAATTGIIGLGFYLSFLGGILKLGWYKISHLGGMILIGGLIALLSQGFFANTLFYPFLLIWIILIIYSVGTEGLEPPTSAM
ncbi:MAG: O-antigen ligase family protein [Candidatus Daviesbacteria bacterium]|nr:MAG: O-antigen ligase family protein [Candidatus Daviesbacteria bacterium]